jgi:hypothetical protein
VNADPNLADEFDDESNPGARLDGKRYPSRKRTGPMIDGVRQLRRSRRRGQGSSDKTNTPDPLHWRARTTFFRYLGKIEVGLAALPASRGKAETEVRETAKRQTKTYTEYANAVVGQQRQIAKATAEASKVKRRASRGRSSAA